MWEKRRQNYSCWNCFKIEKKIENWIKTKKIAICTFYIDNWKKLKNLKKKED